MTVGTLSHIMTGHASRKNSFAIAKQIFSWSSQEQCRRGRL